jgi:predicted dinucleotide-binding enzyme
MKIGILGAKIIGSTLGRKWAKAGHQIMFGVRNTHNPEVLSLAKSLGQAVTIGTTAEAISFGDVVVFAIPGQAMDETIVANSNILNGKIIIDSANKMGGGVMNSVETFRSHTPNAKVYRAFNNLGWENFENPTINGIQVDLFYCGDSGESHHKVKELIKDIGLNPIYLGDLSQVNLIDTIGSLWFALAYGQSMGRHVALKVLRE